MCNDLYFLGIIELWIKTFFFRFSMYWQQKTLENYKSNFATVAIKQIKVKVYVKLIKLSKSWNDWYNKLYETIQQISTCTVYVFASIELCPRSRRHKREDKRVELNAQKRAKPPLGFSLPRVCVFWSRKVSGEQKGTRYLRPTFLSIPREAAPEKAHSQIVFYINIINIENLYPPAMAWAVHTGRHHNNGPDVPKMFWLGPNPDEETGCGKGCRRGQKSFHSHFENMTGPAVPGTTTFPKENFALISGG